MQPIFTQWLSWRSKTQCHDCSYQFHFSETCYILLFRQLISNLASHNHCDIYLFCDITYSTTDLVYSFHNPTNLPLKMEPSDFVQRRQVLCLFIYLGFYVAFNTVQVISRRVVERAEETSTYSSSGFCTVNCRPTASNYQLSHLSFPTWGLMSIPNNLSCFPQVTVNLVE